MKTDTKGQNFEPIRVRTNSTHSRTGNKQCIEGCMACRSTTKCQACQGEYRGHTCGYEGDTSFLPTKDNRDLWEATNGIWETTPFDQQSIPNPIKCKNWRSMNDNDYIEFKEWMISGLGSRWTKGEETYHSDVLGFQGEPLDHAIEEALDLVLYLWMEKRKQNSGE